MLYRHFSHTSKQKKVLFLHGLLGEAKDFIPIIQLLSHFIDCFSFDLPGHGKAPWEGPMNKQTLLDHIRNIIKQNNIDFLVGYSLGGRLAMELDFLHSSLVKKIAIISSHPGLETEHVASRAQFVNKWTTLLHSELGKFLRAWYSQSLFKTLPKKKILKRRKTILPETILWGLEDLGLHNQPNLWKHIEESPKYIFLCGQEDLQYKNLYKSLPKTRIIPDASHALHLESPKKCFKTLHAHFIKTR